MRKQTDRWLRTLGVIPLLLILLVTAWPGAVRGQGPRIDGDMPRHAEGQSEQLADPQGASDYGNWSKLTFASFRDGNWEVYAVWGDGSGLSRLTSNISQDEDPEFDHGATRIAFTSKRPGSYELYKMDADGSNPVQLTSTNPEDRMPTWSPDGTRIAFYTEPDGEIYVLNADGSGLTQLTFDSAWDGHPTWSPDGTQLAFVSNRSGDKELWTMTADGSNQQRLTYGSHSAAYPDWSPDGSRIAFCEDSNWDQWIELAIIDADGTGLMHPLGTAPEFHDYASPTWAPNGDHLAYADDEWYFEDGWQWASSYIYGLDLSDNSTYPLVASGLDRFPDWKSTDALIPTSQVAALPTWSSRTFTVYWSGVDNGPAGLRTYDVQYRDGAGGTWTDWVLDTAETESPFTGVDGHTYYFRCRARDQAYNLEPYPGGDDDTHTTVDDLVPTTVATSPTYIDSLSFSVTWGGNDGPGSGIATYDVQYRDTLDANWTDWLLATTETDSTFTGVHSHTYYFQCRAIDNVNNQEPYPGGNGDTVTLVDVVPPTSTISSPPVAVNPTFLVSWNGRDDYAGVDSYDIQVRDGPSGVWNNWLLATRWTSAHYIGQLGHTYYFQSRARDRSGNLEDYVGGDGGTVTSTPIYEFQGYVRGIRNQPIARTVLQAAPPILTTSLSGVSGVFYLHYNTTGTVAITATHSGFGSLPPIKDVPVTENPPAVTLYLPPIDDRVLNGGFENGDLSSWQLDGHIVPAITTTAHTGDYAALLGGDVPSLLVTPTPAFSVSALISPDGGILTSSLVVANVPAGAVSGPAWFSLIGVPTVIGLPAGRQDVGLHFILRAVLTDGTQLTTTLLPVNLTVYYDDDMWIDAQVDGEETLELWVFNWDSLVWGVLPGVQDTLDNTIQVSSERLSTFALLGTPKESWQGIVEQEVVLTPTLRTGVCSLLYRVVLAQTQDTLEVAFIGPTQTVSYPVELIGGSWVHRWWDLPAWAGPTLTVRLTWSQVERERPAGLILEEISIGDSLPGGYFIYLPLSFR